MGQALADSAGQALGATSGSSSTWGFHHRGMPFFAVFQLDTVEGVRSSAMATLTVPPLLSIISVAVCMWH